MKPHLYAPALGIFVMFSLSMAQHQARAATTSATPPTPCTVDPSSGQIKFNVYALNLPGSTPFQPDLYYNSQPNVYSPPVYSTLISSSPIADDLKKAFAIAPPFFQSQLCSLDAIFINFADCQNGAPNYCQDSNNKPLKSPTIIADSWGFREQPNQYAPGAHPPQPAASPPTAPVPSSPPQIAHYGRFIALSAGPWVDASAHAPIYSAYEQTLFQQLLTWPPVSSTVPQGPTFHGAAPQDTPEMAVLAALAHEFGHVLWYDTFRPIPGGSYDFNTFCRGTFFTNSWQHVDPPKIWRVFGEAANEPRIYGNDIYDVKIADIALYILRGRFSKVSNLLNRIYRPEAHWPSLFATFSPDEDFVETYKFHVLTDPTAGHPLTSLQLDIYSQPTLPSGPSPGPAHSPDIAKDYNLGKKDELARKISCFTQ